MKNIFIILTIIIFNSCDNDGNDINEKAKATGVWPVSGTIMTDRLAAPFGPRRLNTIYDFHRGIDIKAPLGTPVHSILDGIVVRSESALPGSSLERFGNFVVISHEGINEPELSQTIYLHLNEILVEVGEKVKMGQIIGEIGKSGVNINTEHLHFEYHIGSNNGEIKSENSRHPLRLLPYEKSIPDVTYNKVDNNFIIDIIQKHHSIDLAEVSILAEGMDKIIINFETKLGLNPEYLDSNTFNGVTILPMNFNETDQHFHLQIIVERNWNSIENIQMELLDVNGDKTIF